MDVASTSGVNIVAHPRNLAHHVQLVYARSLKHTQQLVEIVKRRNVETLSLAHNSHMDRPNRSNVFCMQFDHTYEQKYLLCGATDGSLCIVNVDASWDKLGQRNATTVAAVNKQSRYAHSHMVSCVEWYPVDTGMFASVSTDCMLKVWDTNRMKPVDKMNLGQPITQHKWSHKDTNTIAVACSSSNVRLVDIRAGCSIQQLAGVHKKPVNCVCWSVLDPCVLLTGGTDGVIALWDVRSAKASLGQFIDYDDLNEMSREESMLKLAGQLHTHTNKNMTQLQKLAQKRVVKKVEKVTVAGPSRVCVGHTAECVGLALSPDGQYLVSLGSEGTIKVWNYANTNKISQRRLPLESGRKVVHLDVSQHTQHHTAGVAFVPTGDDIAVVDLHSCAMQSSLKGHFDSVHSCVYRSSTQQLYSAAADRNILCWHGHTMNHKLGGDSDNEQRIRMDEWSDNDD